MSTKNIFLPVPSHEVQVDLFLNYSMVISFIIRSYEVVTTSHSASYNRKLKNPYSNCNRTNSRLDTLDKLKINVYSSTQLNLVYGVIHVLDYSDRLIKLS